MSGQSSQAATHFLKIHYYHSWKRSCKKLSGLRNPVAAAAAVAATAAIVYHKWSWWKRRPDEYQQRTFQFAHERFLQYGRTIKILHCQHFFQINFLIFSVHAGHFNNRQVGSENYVHSSTNVRKLILLTTIIEIFIWLITHTFIFLKDDGNRSFGNDTTLPLHYVEQQMKYLVCYFLSYINNPDRQSSNKSQRLLTPPYCSRSHRHRCPQWSGDQGSPVRRRSQEIRFQDLPHPSIWQNRYIREKNCSLLSI